MTAISVGWGWGGGGGRDLIAATRIEGCYGGKGTCCVMFGVLETERIWARGKVLLGFYKWGDAHKNRVHFASLFLPSSFFFSFLNFKIIIQHLHNFITYYMQTGRGGGGPESM